MSEPLSQTEITNRCASIESEIDAHAEWLARTKFSRGCLLRGIIKGNSYGSGAVKEIAINAKLSPKTLYQEHAVARLFGYDPAAFDQEIERLRQQGKSVTHEYFKNKLPKRHTASTTA